MPGTRLKDVTLISKVYMEKTEREMYSYSSGMATKKIITVASNDTRNKGKVMECDEK